MGSSQGSPRRWRRYLDFCHVQPSCGNHHVGLRPAPNPGEDEARCLGAWVSPLSRLPHCAPGLERLCPWSEDGAEARRGQTGLAHRVGLHRGSRIRALAPPSRCPSGGPTAARLLPPWDGGAASLSSPLSCSPSTFTVCSLASSPAVLWATQV